MSNIKQQAGMACWVDDNHYEVFEVPSKFNTYPGYGKFLFLSHNKDFNYWTFGEMKFKLNYNKTKNSTSTHDTAYYIPYGAYTFGDENNPNSLRKTVLGKNLTYGGKSTKVVMFDSCNNRKSAHNAIESRTVDQVNKTNNQFKKSINKNTNVRIYKRKHK